MWKIASKGSFPEPNKHIIILTDTGDIHRGYMNEFKFPDDNNFSYSFHGRFYDFSKNQTTYCLINAIAWMPMPSLPEHRKHYEDKIKELQEK